MTTSDSTKIYSEETEDDSIPAFPMQSAKCESNLLANVLGSKVQLVSRCLLIVRRHLWSPSAHIAYHCIANEPRLYSFV